MTSPPSPPTPPPAPAPKPPHVYTYRGEGTSTFQRFAWGFGRALSRILTVILFRLHVGGQNQLPRTGPVLMISNHQSFLDPWLLGVGIARQLHYMARDTLFHGGFLTWLMETLNAFPVKRGTGDRGAIRMAAERLEKGFMINIFAEGTRSEDGTIGPLLPGMVLILRGVKQPVAVVPTILDGAFEAWPRTAKFARPRPIRILYGEPIPSATLLAMTPDQAARFVRERLVALQDHIASPHAAASRARLAAEAPKAA